MITLIIILFLGILAELFKNYNRGYTDSYNKHVDWLMHNEKMKEYKKIRKAASGKKEPSVFLSFLVVGLLIFIIASC
ncbi:MAG: hypothetical protein LBC99_00045 [Spirochaetota bacterium]|jgi:hypothetical protein|nr:hypothetical protein [Spirochaetota bacterium]